VGRAKEQSVGGRGSESVNSCGLQGWLLCSVLTNSLLEEDLEDLRALVTLELNNLSHLIIVDQRAVARKLLWGS